MTHSPPILHAVIAASAALAFAATASAAAPPDVVGAVPELRIGQERGADGGAAIARFQIPEPFEVAAADCSGAAAEAAARTGGQVLSVSSREEGGVTVCVVTILVPGQGGERPRKETITLRQ